MRKEYMFGIHKCLFIETKKQKTNANDRFICFDKKKKI